MVHVGAITVESIPNDNYSIHVIVMIHSGLLYLVSHKYLTGRPIEIWYVGYIILDMRTVKTLVVPANRCNCY